MNILRSDGSHLLKLCSWTLPTQRIRRSLRNTLLLLHHAHDDGKEPSKVQAGKLQDVEVIDHLVIGQGKWVSLKERGLGFV
jgi:hypothetical protein